MPDISVQVPVRNPGGAFGVFLGSLAEQDAEGFTWELVVADDGSAEPVAETFDLSVPGCASARVVRIEGPGNRPAARNAALAEGDAPVSFLTDADLRFEPGVLRFHIDAHRRGLGRVVRGARINAWSSSPSRWQTWFDLRACNLAPAGPMSPRHLVTGNCSIDTALLREAGGFDGSLVGYGGDDTELGLRLGEMGVAMWRDPACRCFHLDEVTVRAHSRKMHEFGANALRMILLRHPAAIGIQGSGWARPVFARPLTPWHAAGRLAARVALWGPVYNAVLEWMEIAGIPRALFSYLSAGACIRGLLGCAR